MKTVTTHEAKTHLSRLLKEVQGGEEITILSGNTPVARLTGIGAPTVMRRKVGSPTSRPVGYDPDVFQPLTEAQLETWSL